MYVLLRHLAQRLLQRAQVPTEAILLTVRLASLDAPVDTDDDPVVHDEGVDERPELALLGRAPEDDEQAASQERP